MAKRMYDLVIDLPENLIIRGLRVYTIGVSTPLEILFWDYRVIRVRSDVALKKDTLKVVFYVKDPEADVVRRFIPEIKEVVECTWYRP